MQNTNQEQKGICVGPMCYDVVYAMEPGTIIGGNGRIRAPKIARGYGGNAVGAARTIAALGGKTDLISPESRCDLGPGFREMAQKSGITIFPCEISEFEIPISSVISCEGTRTIITGSNTTICKSFPSLNPRQYQFLHLDGHFGESAVQCAKDFYEAGVLTSLDAGRMRHGMEDILRFTKVAIVSDDFCRDMKMTDVEMLNYLQYKCKCTIGGVTRGERGILWYDKEHERLELPALRVPNIVDTTNAGDIFHGAYLFSYLQSSEKAWVEHFMFARAASAHSIQHLGINDSLPTYADVSKAIERFPELRAA